MSESACVPFSPASAETARWKLKFTEMEAESMEAADLCAELDTLQIATNAQVDLRTAHPRTHSDGKGCTSSPQAQIGLKAVDAGDDGILWSARVSKVNTKGMVSDPLIAYPISLPY